MLVRTYPDIHSIIHSTIQSFIHSTIIHSRNHSFLPSGIHPSFHACMHPFIRHSFNCLLYLAAAHQCHYNCFFAADDNHLTSLLFSHSSVALCCCTRVSRNCLIRATFSSQSFKSSNVLTSSTNECSTLWPADVRTEQITPSFTITTYRKSQEVPFCKPSVACTVSVTFNCYRTSQNVPWTSRLLYKFYSGTEHDYCCKGCKKVALHKTVCCMNNASNNSSLQPSELRCCLLPCRRHFERVSAEIWSTVSGLVCDVTSLTDGFNQLLPKNILLDVADTCFMLFSQTCFLPLQLHLIVSCKIKAM